MVPFFDTPAESLPSKTFSIIALTFVVRWIYVFFLWGDLSNIKTFCRVFLLLSAKNLLGMKNWRKHTKSDIQHNRYSIGMTTAASFILIIKYAEGCSLLKLSNDPSCTIIQTTYFFLRNPFYRKTITYQGFDISAMRPFSYFFANTNFDCKNLNCDVSFPV